MKPIDAIVKIMFCDIIRPTPHKENHKVKNTHIETKNDFSKNLNIPQLSSSLGHALQHIINSGKVGISSVGLAEKDVLNPSKAVSRLKAKGAFIETQMKPTKAKSGKDHKAVAYYTYKGWDKSK
jgi:hypothetical protein